MEQQLSQINTNSDLIEHLDALYQKAVKRKNGEKGVKFQYLYKKIANKVTIDTAIHNIKSNRGIHSVGVDNKSIDELLQMKEEKLVDLVLESLNDYKPQKTIRKTIPKSSGGERRIGISTIFDRIIQETIKIILEPICEGQFYNHSYGYRPHRSTEHALALLQDKMYMIKDVSWAIVGDISNFFDEIDHKIMIEQLKGFGIMDMKVLAIIREMLSAGIMNECEHNEQGITQGGVLSPLLANVYLHRFDMWIVSQWEEKKTDFSYSRKDVKINALRKTKLKPAYLVRYADDWIILTNSKANAIWWKDKTNEYLQKNLKIKLSSNKILISNIRKKYISFLGYELKLIKNNRGKEGYVNTARPNLVRLREKIKVLKQEIQKIPKESKPEYVLSQINKVNSITRGLVHYYEVVSQASLILKKYDDRLYKTKTRAVLPHGGKMIQARKVDNLIGVHEKYKQKIPTVVIQGKNIGLTSLAFLNYRIPYNFPFKLTSYSKEGRKLYIDMRKKRPLSIRVDEICSMEYSEKILKGLTAPIYNYEFFLNRAYAFNRDGGKCKICKELLTKETLETHHNNVGLPTNRINRLENLSSLCAECHKVIHTESPKLDRYTTQQIKKIMELKTKLCV